MIAALVLAAGLGIVASAPDASAAGTEPVISEVVAQNDSGLVDADGDRPDWIEIHNPASTAVDMAGWVLTDDPHTKTWRFPSLSLPADGYLVVFASDKYRLDPAEMHTNFKLSSTGDRVHLLRPDGTLASSIVFGSQTADRSIGPSSTGGTVTFSAPTPGQANFGGATAPPRRPEFSHARGLYDQAFWLSVPTIETDAVVRFTTDGTEPTTSSPVLNEATEISRTTVVRAKAWNGAGESETATATYVFVNDVMDSSVMSPGSAAHNQYRSRLAASLRSLPSVSLVTPSPLVESEYRAISMEFLEPDGDNFQIDAGIKIYGATSLRDPKKNLRLKFSSEFGPTKLEYPLYEGFETGAAHGIVPATSFDQLQLRQGSGDSQFRDRLKATHLRNTLADDMMLLMGIPNPHNRFVHVYDDGVYQGVYQLRERFDADFMASYFGGDESEYVAVNRNKAFDGSTSVWDELRASAKYDHLKDKLDIDAFADLAVYQWWNGTTDWPETRNWMAAGPADLNSPIGWIFHNNDHDWGLGRTGLDTNSLRLAGPSSLLRGLNRERHPDWVDAVSRSISRNLYNGGPMTPPVAVAQFNRRADQIEPALVAESVRWPNGGWDVDGEWQDNATWLRNTWYPQRTDIVIGQLGDTYRTVDAPEIFPCCAVAAGTEVTISTVDATSSIVYTTDDTDPRLPGGEVSPTATTVHSVASTTLRVDESTVVTARVMHDGNWSPPMRWDLRVVDQPAPVVLNEWNAVKSSNLIEESDLTLGVVGGNGGDWFELAVTSDHADLRGYRFEITESGVPSEAVVFSDHLLWSDLRSGTIITVSEDIATDVSYDPEGGDWHINVAAALGGSQTYVSANNFAVSSANWQLTIRNSAGGVVFGPAGEGIGGMTGVSDSEVGELKAPPTTTPNLAEYGDSNGSTFGLPNQYDGGFQDFSILRRVVSRTPDVDGSGAVDADDVRAILGALVGDPVEGYRPGAGDLDADSDTELDDAMALAQCLADPEGVYCTPQ